MDYNRRMRVPASQRYSRHVLFHGLGERGQQRIMESAVAMPKAGFGDQYLHSDVFEMAAAYLFHIVQNHPFVDGNKRTGAMAAFTFLKLNRFTLSAQESEFERIVRMVAEGRMGKPKVAEFLRKNSRKRR